MFRYFFRLCLLEIPCLALGARSDPEPRFEWSLRVFCAPLRSVILGLLVGAVALPAFSNPIDRSSFPGRRVGGGTRGDCTSRVLAHLVPLSSIYSPGSTQLLAILQGPTPEPRPLQVSLRRVNALGTTDSARLHLSQRVMNPLPAGVVLFSALSDGPLVWESSYRCTNVIGPDGDFGFDAPPAVSLLIRDASDADRLIQAQLNLLKDRCGRSVPAQRLVRDFQLGNLDVSDWPEQLPVRCFSEPKPR